MSTAAILIKIFSEQCGKVELQIANELMTKLNWPTKFKANKVESEANANVFRDGGPVVFRLRGEVEGSW